MTDNIDDEDQKACAKCARRNWMDQELVERLLRCKNIERLPTDILTACTRVEQAQPLIDEALSHLEHLLDRLENDRKRRNKEFKKLVERLDRRVSRRMGGARPKEGRKR